jgi:hypothetical protein
MDSVPAFVCEGFCEPWTPIEDDVYYFLRPNEPNVWSAIILCKNCWKKVNSPEPVRQKSDFYLVDLSVYVRSK